MGPRRRPVRRPRRGRSGRGRRIRGAACGHGACGAEHRGRRRGEPGRAGHLRDLPQRSRAARQPLAGALRRDARGRARRGRRTDGPQAAGGHDAAARTAPAGACRSAEPGRNPRAPPRRGGRARARPGQPSVPAPQPQRVRAGRPRPAGPGHRRGRLAAARSRQRQLRQHRRRPDPVGDAARGVPERGRRHQPARGRRAPGPGRRSHLHQLGVRVAAPVGPRPRGSLRDTRRPRGRPRVPGRRRVRLRPDVHLRGEHAPGGHRRLDRRRAGGAAALQHRPAGRRGRPGRGVHRDPADLRPRRDAPRGGGVHPPARRPLRGPHPPARLVLCRGRLGRAGHHHSAARPRPGRQRPLQRDRPLGDAEPAAHLHLPADGARGGAPVCAAHPRPAGARSLPSHPDRPRSGGPAGLLRRRLGARRLRGGRPDCARGAAGQPALRVAPGARARRRAGPGLPAERRRPRLAPVVLPVGRPRRTTSCRRSRTRGA